VATRSKDGLLPPIDLSDPIFHGITEEDIKDLDLESMPPCMVGGKPYDPDEVELTYAHEVIVRVTEKHKKERQERERRERERQQSEAKTPETKPSKS
jgi:hypothetical protein